LRNGYFALALTEVANISVISIDRSIESLLKAKERVRKKVALVRMDLHNLPFRESIFEYVISEIISHDIEKQAERSSSGNEVCH
jgi:ubiquinone/menaquinone biosynthesis C-methylase UbiE